MRKPPSEGTSTADAVGGRRPGDILPRVSDATQEGEVEMIETNKLQEKLAAILALMEDLTADERMDVVQGLVDLLPVAPWESGDYREWLDFMDWSPRDAAAVFRVHETRSRKWANAKVAIPLRMVARMTMARKLLTAPPPPGGRHREDEQTEEGSEGP